jgi:hypothetical protein
MAAVSIGPALTGTDTSVPNLLSARIDATGGALISDSLSVGVPGNALGPDGAELDVLVTDTSAVPPPMAGLGLGSSAFLITLKDVGTGSQLSQLSVPLTLSYRLTGLDVSQAGGDLGRVKLAQWNGNAWVAQSCSTSGQSLSCFLPRAGLFAVITASVPSDVLDSPLSGGWFYKQANGFDGAGDVGFAVVDDADAPFWTEFQRLGGADKLGYPISVRFQYAGLATQVFQRVALQWRPDLGRAVPVDILDELTKLGVDSWLEFARQVPPAGPTTAASQVDDSGHLILLGPYPDLGYFYASNPDVQLLYGLPETVKRYGPVITLRLQRGLLQLWTTDVPWASAGTVAVGSAGDLAKEAGLWPADVLSPVPSPAATDSFTQN